MNKRFRHKKLLICSVACTAMLAVSGCKSTGGWGWSTPTWLSWGGQSSAAANSPFYAQTPKPSATVPTTTGLAASTPGAAAQPSSTPPAATTAAAAPAPTNPWTSYPTTAQGFQYPAQTAAANQTATGSAVAPAGGYQPAGPYGMTSAPVAQAGPYPANYGAPAPAPATYPQNYSAPAPAGYNQPAPAPYGASPYGASPYGAQPAQVPPGGYGAASPPVYQAPAAPQYQFATTAQPPAVAAQPEAAPYATTAQAQPANTAAPANTLPTNLQSTGGYRPGSTGRFEGVSPVGYEASGAASGGAMWR